MALVPTNVGGNDRLARLVLGPLLLVVGIAGYVGVIPLAVGPVPAALASVVVALVGAILLVTGLTRRCPLNSVFGVNTAGREESSGRTGD